MRYSIAKHHHLVAAWASARAAQRRLAKTCTIITSLNGCGVVPVVETLERWPATPEAFDRVHRDWCRNLLKSLKSAGVSNAQYGHAAKILAIYLKSRIVLGGYHDTPFARVMHPPIDSFLLKQLATELRQREDASDEDRRLATFLKTTTWTTLNEAKYDKLIGGLRKAGFDQPAFWCIEQFWNPWTAPDSMPKRS
jgi:hypothetical protein